MIAVLGRAARRVIDLPRLLVVLLLKLYRLVVSPLYGQTCRFYPSCSAYALEAVQRYGVIRGGRLAVWRLLRCNPWNPGGVDPVPTKGEHSSTGDGPIPAPTPKSKRASMRRVA